MSGSTEPVIAGLTDAVRVAAADFAAGLSTVAPSTPVAATPAWSAHDVATHVVAAIALYRQGPHGEAEVVDDPAELPALNERLRRPYETFTNDELASAVIDDTAALAEEISAYGDAPPSYRFNGGCPVRADRALGLLLGELVVHGHDLAAAAGRELPIRAAHVEMIVAAMEDVLPGFVNPTTAGRHTATYDVRLRGGSRHVWRFRDGGLTCGRDASRSRADCHVSGDPAALLLVMYRRRAPRHAAATGRILAWGRRPWLALSLPNRFFNP